MAMSSNPKMSEGMTAGKRLAIGANVTIAIVAAAALLVAVNWISSLKYVRKDVATFSNYGLSDRTKRILGDNPTEIQLWVLYPPNPADEKQQEYINRLQDYCDELTSYGGKRVKVTYVQTADERAQLVGRISSTSGAEAGKHQEALKSFETLRQEVEAEIQRRITEGTAVMSVESWLSEFPLFTSVVTTLKADRDALQKAADEIKELTPAGGIPKFGEATTKAKQALSDLKNHFDLIDQRLGDLAGLADEVSRPDSPYLAMLREVAMEANNAVASLRQTVGAKDAPLPADAAASLRAFKEKSDQVGAELEKLVKQVDDFAAKFPIVKSHSSWKASVRMGPMAMKMEVADVLAQASNTLGQIRLAILNVLDRGDADKLREALIGVREEMGILEQNAVSCEVLLTTVANRLSKMDQASQAIVQAARGGAFLAAKAKAIDAAVKQFEGLPELKLASVADQLKEDNVIVVEAKDKIRVVAFNEVFPMRESVAGPGGGKNEELGRTFNGDSALSSAVLALTRDHPFATVVLTSYEPEPPQQRNPYMPPPPQSWIPTRALSTLRQRLEASNFKVVDWNLATSEEAPKPEEGTESLYVVLPPAPDAPPNPFQQQQQPQEKFGEPQRKKLRDLLDKDARMIFLATWEVASGGMFGMPTTPRYGLAPLLETDWGITVDNSRRVVWIEPDRQKADTLMVVPRRFGHMPVGGFTDQPVGRAMQGTRFLANDACPLEVKKELPAGVKVESILQIPDREYYIAAKVQEIIQIIDALKRYENEGRVTLRPYPPHGPFDLMLAAERTEGEKSKGRIIVMSFGASLRDDYLNNPVVASNASDALRLESPPTENADLFINALYWLQGRQELIARGPAPVPQVMLTKGNTLIGLRVLVYAVWPALMFLPGVVLWWRRRR